MPYNNRRTVLGAVCACLSLVLLVGSAQAEVLITFSGSNTVGSWSDQLNVPIDPLTGDFGLQDGYSQRAAWEAEDIYAIGNADPWLNFGFTIRNTAAVVSDYTVSFFLPVIDSFNTTWTSGSVGITLSDPDLSGSAELTSTGSLPIYQSRLDGVDHMSLKDAAYVLQVLQQGGTSSDSADFGVPGNTVLGGPLTSSMEVVLNFSLSPGDRAIIFGTFVAVPEPSSFLLAAMGLVALGWVTHSKRRRGATCSVR